MEDSASARSYLKMPVVLLFGSQFLASIALFLAALPAYLSFADEMPTMPVILVVQGGMAGVIGLAMGLSKWWIPVQIALPFGAFYSTSLQVPAWLWLVFLVLAGLVYRNSGREGVPLYLSNRTTWTALADMLPQTQGLKIIDIGGGIGGTALFLARQRPDAEVLSVESAPIPAVLAKLRGALSGLKNVTMVYGDFWKQDLDGYQVAYAFLSPVPMERLYKKVRAEMKPGSLFISNSFEVPGVEADQVVELNDSRQTKLYLWRN